MLSEQTIEEGLRLKRAVHAATVRMKLNMSGDTDSAWWNARTTMRDWSTANPTAMAFVLNSWFIEHVKRAGCEPCDCNPRVCPYGREA